MIELLYDYLIDYLDYYDSEILIMQSSCSIINDSYISIAFNSIDEYDIKDFIESLEKLKNKGLLIDTEVEDTSEVTQWGDIGPYYELKSFIDCSNLNENIIKSLTVIEKFNL